MSEELQHRASSEPRFVEAHPIGEEPLRPAQVPQPRVYQVKGAKAGLLMLPLVAIGAIIAALMLFVGLIALAFRGPQPRRR